MLAGDADDGLHGLPALQLIDQGAHLDGFGTGAEDEHNFFHRFLLLSSQSTDALPSTSIFLIKNDFRCFPSLIYILTS